MEQKKEMTDFAVVENRRVAETYVELVLRPVGKLAKVVPGQFAEVRVEGAEGVMLRRPISIHDIDTEANTLSLLVQIVGRGTRRLSQLASGERLNLVYPLGKGFSRPKSTASHILLVGGGAGIAPLYYLAKTLSREEVHITTLLGGRSEALIPARDKFMPLGEVCLTTDDGSAGVQGLVVDHPCFAEAYDMIYTCGPTPMMKAVARSAAARDMSCEVSLENLMACGLGACLCCVVDTDTGHQRVCKEGPVFDISGMTKWYELC
ncbi:MAG: dihydroorotate dehydrogenase electron transfer subunit [Bacteroidales bacterium]|nr:dihydroorotate dehydrogenase electron transfer subunit [Bacteroidales bacterium]